MSRTTLDVVSVTGSRCEVSADSPSAAATEVSASSTGTAAASSAPNATTRITSVTGRLSTSARWKSSPYVFCSAFSIVPPPTSSTRRSGWAAWTAAVASTSGCTRSAASCGSPVISARTSTAVPPGDVTGADDAGHLGPATQPPAGLGRRRGRRGPVQRPGPGRDQDVLHRRVGEVGVGQHPLGPAPLADRLLRVGLRGGAGHAADRDADHDERHPAQHRPPAVLRTPSRDPYHPARAPVRHCFVLPPRHLRGRRSSLSAPGPGVRTATTRLRGGVVHTPIGRLPGSAKSARVPTVEAVRTSREEGDEVTVERGATARELVERSTPDRLPAPTPAAAPVRVDARRRPGAAAVEDRRVADDGQHPHRALDRVAVVRDPRLAAAGRAGAHAGVPGRPAAARVRVAGLALVRRPGPRPLPAGARRRHPLPAPGREARRQRRRPVPHAAADPGPVARGRLRAAPVPPLGRGGGARRRRLAAAARRADAADLQLVAAARRRQPRACSPCAAGGRSRWSSWSACCC